MENKEYIESGILELYVYGLLTESENDEVNAMANKNPEIKAEIISIEKAIINFTIKNYFNKLADKDEDEEQKI